MILLALVTTIAHAETVRIIVPFTAGGSTDLAARAMESTLAQALPQYHFEVEYKLGAGGSVAANYVAQDKNKETILLVSSLALLINSLNPDSTYNINKDFIPVVNLGGIPGALVTSKQSNITTLQSLLKSKQQLTFGSAGPRTATHIAGEILKQRTGLKLVHVPYKGESAALVGVMSNNIDLMFLGASMVQEYTESNKLQILAVTGTHRNSALPMIPTFAELGVKGFEVSPNWMVVLANTTADPVIITQTQNALANALKDPEVVKLYNKSGVDIDPKILYTTDKFLQSETTRMKKILDNLDLK